MQLLFPLNYTTAIIDNLIKCVMHKGIDFLLDINISDFWKIFCCCLVGLVCVLFQWNFYEQRTEMTQNFYGDNWDKYL